MTGKDLLEALQKLTPEQLALSVDCSYMEYGGGEDVETSNGIHTISVTTYPPCITLWSNP